MSRVFVDIGEFALNHHGRRFCWEVAHLFHLILVVIELLRTRERLHFIISTSPISFYQVGIRFSNRGGKKMVICVSPIQINKCQLWKYDISWGVVPIVICDLWCKAWPCTRQFIAFIITYVEIKAALATSTTADIKVTR